MKRIFLLSLIIAGCALTSFAQNREIVFEEPDLEKAMKKAKKEKKLVFIDCFADWCGPCKYMAQAVFTKDEVADYFNANFINVVLDIDNEKDGIMLAEKHKIGNLPTFIWLDPATGEVAHRVMGSSQWEGFLAQAKEANDNQNNIIGMGRRYKNGERDPQFVAAYLGALKKGAEYDRNTEVYNDYFKDMPDDQFYTKTSWDILAPNVTDIKQPIYQRMMNDRERFYGLVGREAVNKVLDNAIENEIWALTRISKDNAMRGVRVNEQKVQSFVDYLISTDYDNVPAFAWQMYYLRARRQNNMDAMLQILKDGFDYNILKGKKGKDLISSYSSDFTRGNNDWAGKYVELLDIQSKRTSDPELLKVILSAKQAAEANIGKN